MAPVRGNQSRAFVERERGRRSANVNIAMPSRRTSRPRATRRTDANQPELPLAGVHQQMVAAMNAALESGTSVAPVKAEETQAGSQCHTPAAQPPSGESARLLPSP